ncbi:hypothetical protein OT109_19295 [Phycisphaeraceae bacterium D3-23]
MKPATSLAAVVLASMSAVPLVGCDGESPTKSIQRTEDKLNDYALTQIYAAATVTGEPLDASSLKSQIDPLVGQYGEEAVIDKIKEIAVGDEPPATRAAAVFSIQPYVDADTYNGMVDALDDDARRAFDTMTR